MVNNPVHIRNTRYANFSLVCAKYLRGTEGGKPFLAKSLELWNSLPLEIRCNDSLPASMKCLWNVIFKEELKLNHFMFTFI